MIKTASLLIVTLIVFPMLAYFFSAPLTELQWHTLQHVFKGATGVALLCFTLSQLTNNYSQVDKIWSIAPIGYAAYIAYAFNWEPRVLLMAVLVAIWGIRLTYNFSRRGGYSLKFWEGEEDYRWEILRKRKEFQNPLALMLFNFFFVSLYQNFLIMSFTLPLIAAAGHPEIPLGLIDLILAFIVIALVVIETIADQQQWDFQGEKHTLIKQGKPLVGRFKSGFIHDGLFGVVRHPNYAAEQSIWVVIFLMSIYPSGEWVNWSGMGCLLLILLFKASCDFSEGISSGKYPDYLTYCKQIPRFIPIPGKKVTL